MCTTCGCSDTDGVTVIDPAAAGGHDARHGHGHAHGHDHAHEHAHSHEHSHGHDNGHVHDHSRGDGHVHWHEHPLSQEHEQRRTLSLTQDILAENQLAAARNRGWFAGRGIVALNLMSSPGAGKTTLLERTIRDCSSRLPISVIEGDQATVNDARRILATGCKAIQINTGTGCHLDANMLARGVETLKPPSDSLLMIENVGNLVCPALFDLGERAKVVILSVTEGDDKPLKYPHMFRAADVLVLNKIDLLPYVNFEVAQCIEHARTINPGIRIFELSATSGQGLDGWYSWLGELAHGSESRGILA
jgi:hydrogenase nickel incorporation protein HypB